MEKIPEGKNQIETGPPEKHSLSGQYLAFPGRKTTGKTGHTLALLSQARNS
jgi:hypothetical protein